MQRIYAAIFGSGLGHATRSYAVASRLEQNSNCQFLFSTFDEGFEYFKSKQEVVTYAPSVGLKWNLAGGFSGSDTLIRFPLAFSSFSKQVAFETQEIKKYNPRVILSDSRLSAVFAGKSMFYPVVTILNQLRILLPPRFRSNLMARAIERIEADVLGLLWSFSNEILFPDLPPPYTIGEANIARVDTSAKVTFTGFMIQKAGPPMDQVRRIRSLLQLDSRPVVFMQISGPSATKQAFIDSALLSAVPLSKKFNVIISKGIVGGSKIPMKLSNGAWVYDWCPIKDELFELSDVLVARSGHTTIGQCINAAKPSVLVPIFNHSEQIWNAEKFEKLGLGIEIKSGQLSSNRLERAVEDCIDDKTYKQNMEKVKSISDRFDGIERAADTLQSFL